jgi:phage tail-like protein
MVFELTGSDPYRAMKYRVIIPGFENMGFSKISGISQESDVIEYRDGNQALTMRKYPGLIKQGEVTLERGVSNSKDTFAMLAWREAASTTLAGGGGRDGLGLYKLPVTIQVMDRTGALSYIIQLDEAWPMRFEYSDLDASSSEILIASLVLAHEGVNAGITTLAQLIQGGTLFAGGG